MKHFFTADPHFFHSQIIAHCKRPFDSVEAMHATMLTNLQKTVERGDNLWILGDFAYRCKPEDAARIFAKIPGQKHLILGNHDKKNKAVLRLSWASVHDTFALRDGDQHFYMCHYPLMTWPSVRHGAIHLFGHVHNNWAGSANSVNVGVDWWNFHPIDKDAIVARANTLPPLPLLSTLEPGIPQRDRP